MDMSPPAAPGAATQRAARALSQQVTVTGAVSTPLRLDLAALKALPSASLTVGQNTFTGVSLWALLNGPTTLKSNPAVMNGTVAMYVVATGSDGYQAVLSIAEIDPSFGNRPVLVAYDMNGTGLGRNGNVRLVVGGDTKMGRSVSNLTSIAVSAVGPVPGP